MSWVNIRKSTPHLTTGRSQLLCAPFIYRFAKRRQAKREAKSFLAQYKGLPDLQQIQVRSEEQHIRTVILEAATFRNERHLTSPSCRPRPSACELGVLWHRGGVAVFYAHPPDKSVQVSLRLLIRISVPLIVTCHR